MSKVAEEAGDGENPLDVYLYAEIIEVLQVDHVREEIRILHKYTLDASKFRQNLAFPPLFRP